MANLFGSYWLVFIALLIWSLGYLHTGKYVRPKWKIHGKLVFYLTVACVLIHFFGCYALIFILGHPLIGLVFHIQVCKRHGINWLNCQPIDKYLSLQEKWSKGDFK
ncbi:MAG: hypothetical protein AAGC88_07895 [Bacteroidota bacterium]